MPLELPVQKAKGPYARPQMVVWNPEVYDEATEARERIAELKNQGFTPTSEAEGAVELAAPLRDENKRCFRILSQNGDDIIVWDRRVAAQVKQAYKKCKELLDKGYTAYTIMRDGSRGHKITEFNPALQEILMGAGEAVEAVFVPKTVPG